MSGTNVFGTALRGDALRMTDVRIMPRAQVRVEWPTVGFLIICYSVFALALFYAPFYVAVLLIGFAVALHASLTHEVVHGHPFANATLNAALVFPAVTLVVPFARFRETHLAHHQDEALTDPYDDPETNYLDPVVWARLPRIAKAVLRFNNTLAGRLTVGPMIGQIMWMKSDWRACRRGDTGVLKGWLAHLPALALMVGVIWIAPISGWTYVAGAYLGLSILRLRTYLEHRAHEKPRARTVIVEDRGLFALLFLNNNLHVVHHMHPAVPWYDLPALYRAHQDHYQRRNEGYVYRSYLQILRTYMWRAKDTVPHPIWRRGDE